MSASQTAAETKDEMTVYLAAIKAAGLYEQLIIADALKRRAGISDSVVEYYLGAALAKFDELAAQIALLRAPAQIAEAA